MIITTPCPMILWHWIRPLQLTKTVSLRQRRFWKTASFCGFIPREHTGLAFSNIFLFRKSTIPSKLGKDPLCQCTLLLRYKMQYLSYSQWKYQNRFIEICEQSGFAKSKRGSFSVTYRYNEQLGLVEAIYDYNHEVRIQLSLINVL